MLRITDEGLDLTNTEEVNINGKNTLISIGTYSPMPSACKNSISSVTDRDGKITIRNEKIVTNIKVIIKYGVQ